MENIFTTKIIILLVVAALISIACIAFSIFLIKSGKKKNNKAEHIFGIVALIIILVFVFALFLKINNNIVVYRTLQNLIANANKADILR